MAKSILLRKGDYIDKKTQLIQKLEKGEQSGFVQEFDRRIFMKNLHNKHLKDKL